MYNEIDSYSGREFFQSKDPLSIGVRERKSKNEYELRVSYGNFDKDDHKTLNGIDIFLREFFDENPNAIVKFDNNYIDGNFFIGDFERVEVEFNGPKDKISKSQSNLLKDLDFVNKTLTKEQFEKTQIKRNDRIIKYCENELNSLLEKFREKLKSDSFKEHPEDIEMLKENTKISIKSLKDEIRSRQENIWDQKIMDDLKIDGEKIRQYNEINEEIKLYSEHIEKSTKYINQKKSQANINDHDSKNISSSENLISNLNEEKSKLNEKKDALSKDENIKQYLQEKEQRNDIEGKVSEIYLLYGN